MRTWGLIALALVVAFTMTACAASPDGASSSSTDRAVPASSEPTQALAGVWVPESQALQASIHSLTLGADGSVVESLTTTNVATDGSFDGEAIGRWSAAGEGEVAFTQAQGIVWDASTASYRFAREGDTLTLTWVSGTPPKVHSHGPVHFPTAEGDSWVTGSHEQVVFVLKR